MLEIVAGIFLVLAVIFVTLVAFHVFVTFLTAASYVSPFDDDLAQHCQQCKGTNCLGCKCSDVECCHDVRF